MISKSDNFIDFLKSNFNKRFQFSLHEPIFSGREKEYLNNVIDSTFVSSSGEFLNLFEKSIAEYTTSRKAITCINGTAALHISLLVAGVNAGDEVLTQALSFVATSNAISYLNAKPIFIDVDIDTMGMSPVALSDFLEENAILTESGTFNKKTRKKISACVPMHTFGLMCRIDEIKKICNRWNIILIEDAAEALGSKYNNIHSGKFGLLSSFSFNGNKIITSGGGGCIITQDDKIFKKAKHLITTAKISKNWEFVHNKIGFNYRMPNINAALGLAQVEQINQKIKAKEKLYNFYNEILPTLGLNLSKIPENTFWNYWLMSIQLENEREKESFLENCNKNNVFVRPIWKLLFKLKMYRDCQRDSQKNAQILEETIVNIPSNLEI